MTAAVTAAVTVTVTAAVTAAVTETVTLTVTATAAVTTDATVGALILPRLRLVPMNATALIRPIKIRPTLNSTVAGQDVWVSRGARQLGHRAGTQVARVRMDHIGTHAQTLEVHGRQWIQSQYTVGMNDRGRMENSARELSPEDASRAMLVVCTSD